MALLIRKEVGESALLGVWKIEEEEAWYFTNPLLTDRVQTRIDGYKSVLRKLQAIAVRILIKALLPEEENVDIDYNEKNKPFFVVAPYRLSISHSDTMVAVLISAEGEVGVDVEKLSPKVERVAHKFTNSDEQRIYNNVKEAERFDYLHILWGAKESMFKLYGKGSLDFRENLIIPSFDLKAEGEFVGTIEKGDKLISINGFYSKVGKFALIYVLESQDYLVPS